MKRKQMKNRLSLNKATVARLTNKEIVSVQGGAAPTIIIVASIALSECICTEFPNGTCQCTRPDVC